MRRRSDPGGSSSSPHSTPVALATAGLGVGRRRGDLGEQRRELGGAIGPRRQPVARPGQRPRRLVGIATADSDGQTGPLFFAVRDAGNHPSLVWTFQLPRPAQASAAQDPRGGLWVFGAGDGHLVRLADEPDRQGHAVVLQQIDVGALSSGGVPASAMSIAGAATDPVMLVSSLAVSVPGLRPELLAIRLSDSALLWRVDTGAPALGQFPILRAGDGAPVVAESTSQNGVVFIR